MEAVKQGSAVCGLRSKTTAVCFLDYFKEKRVLIVIQVLAALRRTASDLASPQQKLFKIDGHMGIGVSGLIADARGLSVYMRGEALNHQVSFLHFPKKCAHFK
jgi:20S proteasome subunit alpha 6